MTAKQVRARLRRLGNSKKANVLQGFFKTGPGQYGEGDVFVSARIQRMF